METVELEGGSLVFASFFLHAGLNIDTKWKYNTYEYSYYSDLVLIPQRESQI